MSDASLEKPEQLSWVSSLLGIGSPWRSMVDHRIQDDEQRGHAGNPRHLFGLPSCKELVIDSLDDGVPCGRDARSHLQGRSDHHSAAPDGALAVQRATVAIVGRHPDQGS